MFKDKLNYKIVNVLLLVIIIYLLYQMGYLWMGLTDKAIAIIGPFFIAFAIAYALSPAVNYLTRKKIPKAVAILSIVGLFVGILTLLVILIAPMLVSQSISLLTGIVKFLKEAGTEYNINFDALMSTINSSLDKIGMYTTNSILSLLSTSLGLISTFFIIFSAAIYFLIDFDKIRESIKEFLYAKNKKIYNYVRELDIEMKKYLVGFFKIAVISFFEYSICFLVIGHPNAILLGMLASIAGLIPYFGGIITNIIAMITAFVVSPALFFKTVVVFIILSQVDGYVINPLVYGKTNELHPLIVIFAVFACGALMGVLGVMMSLPIAIILITTYTFFKEEIRYTISSLSTDNKDDKNGTK